MNHKIRVVPYRRKRELRTDYRLRMKLLQGRQPRLVVRSSNKHVAAQLVQYHPDGDRVLVTASTQHLKKYGWTAATGSTPAAYLVGVLIGKAAKQHNVASAIVDLGMSVSRQGGKLYAVAKGAIDAGLNVPCDVSMFPTEERLAGKHISDYALNASGTQFSATKKSAGSMEQLVQTTKSAILK